MLRLNHVDDTHCQGIVFEVTDIDALARTIAVVLVQEYELARQLVTGDSACTGAITLENSDIEDIIQRRLHPTVDYHRDGFLFQLMMWLAAYLDLEDGDIVALPHSQGSAKGQDSIIVHRSERAVVALTICEDKATENPRDTVREEVWPEIEDYERGERHDELRSNIIATLGTSGIPMTEAVDLIRGISWAGKRRYRVRVTVEPNRRTPKLFNGFDEIVSGGSEMRRGETVPLPSLRTWMATLAGKIETTPLPLSSNAVAPEVAAALLFLIGGYQTDAAETTKAFTPTGTSQATGQLLDFIAALASGNGQELRRIADTLLVMVHRADVDYLDAAADAMWLELARAIQSIARTVLGLGADDPLAVLNGVLERLSRANKEVQLGNSTAWLHLPLAGPYHLARLLHAATEVLRTSTHPITHN